jgi:hypothetical protein
MQKTEDQRRIEYIQGLRALADFLESRPQVPCPRYTNISVFTDRAGLVTAAQTAGWEKIYNANWFYLRKAFSPGNFEADLTLDITADRGLVCRKVATGTTTIPAQPERTLPAEPEQVVEQFEWVCDEPLLATEAVPHG